jgi:hypothetical protein
VTLSVTTVVVVVLVLLLTRTRLGSVVGFGKAPPCTLTTSTGDVSWSTVQAMTATTVAGVGTRIGATENGIAAAVRRSLALERTEPISATAARQLYRQLPDVAKPSGDSLAVARALLGRRGPALACVLTASAGHGLATESTGRLGLTPRAEALRLALREVFGRQSLGGFAPGGVTTGHIEGSAHYEGRAIDVFFRPVRPETTRGGWQTAIWAVAHADRLDVATVIFDRSVWTAARSLQGWRDYEYPGGATDNPVLLHEDHVHVDVQRGGDPPADGLRHAGGGAARPDDSLVTAPPHYGFVASSRSASCRRTDASTAAPEVHRDHDDAAGARIRSASAPSPRARSSAT